MSTVSPSAPTTTVSTDSVAMSTPTTGCAVYCFARERMRPSESQPGDFDVLGMENLTTPPWAS